MIWYALLALASFQENVPSPNAPLPELLPREREIALALSAGPERIREGASVYVLEAKGYVKARDGSNGFTCLVERDAPQNQKPTCWDREGSETIVPKVLRVGELVMQGRPAEQIDTEIRAGFKSGKFIAPRRPGIAYMLSKENRLVDPQTGKTALFPPHLLFYAPNLTNEDIGSSGDGKDGLPFIGYQGPNGYMIVMVK